MKFEKFFKNKKILITGGSGMIGLSLIKKLRDFDCVIKICSIDDYRKIKKYIPNKVKFIKLDLRIKKNCLKIF